MTRIAMEPRGTIHSLDELLTIAHAMETDAAARYVETARLLRARGASSLAELFDRLAAVERSHVTQVEDWARVANRLPPADRPLPWPIPDTFDVSPAEAGHSSTLTAYRALSAAVRHEERSFTFWSYVSAHAERDDVRAAAEKMAHEELEHVSILRRERRKAFHQERRTSFPAAITLAKIADLEERMAGLIEVTPSSPIWPAGSEPLASDARAMAAGLRRLESKYALPGPMPVLADDAVTLAEFLVEAYLRMADESEDEALLALAQTYAAIAIRRLAAFGSNIATRRSPDG